MNISLPDSLKTFVDEQVSQGGYGTSSEYVRELIRKDRDRLQLRGLLHAVQRPVQQHQRRAHGRGRQRHARQRRPGPCPRWRRAVR